MTGFRVGFQPATELPKEEMVARSPPKGVDFSRHTAPRLFEGSLPPI